MLSNFVILSELLLVRERGIPTLRKKTAPQISNVPKACWTIPVSTD